MYERQCWNCASLSSPIAFARGPTVRLAYQDGSDPPCTHSARDRELPIHQWAYGGIRASARTGFTLSMSQVTALSGIVLLLARGGYRLRTFATIIPQMASYSNAPRSCDRGASPGGRGRLAGRDCPQARYHAFVTYLYHNCEQAHVRI